MSLKNKIKTLIYFFLNVLCLFLPRPKKAAILLYHSVDKNRSLFTVKPEEFKRQMDCLQKKKYNVVSLAELIDMIERGSIPKKTVVLTFDDGFRDFYFNALPVLKEHNFKATMFLSTGFIGKKRESRTGDWLQVLNWSEIKAIHQTGLVDFQPHTMTHLKLDKVPASKAKEEILGSKMTVESELGKKCRLFAYPYGNCNKEVIKILKDNGFKTGLTVEQGLVSKKDNLFQLKRNTITSLTGFQQFNGKICCSIDIFNSLKR